MGRKPDPLADVQGQIDRVYAYVAYRVGDGSDAEDITSATLERAVRYRDRYDVRKGDAAAWLIGIARREISQHFSAAPQVVAELPDEPGPDDLEPMSAMRIDLQRAVAQLEPRQRELVALRYGADLTARQIGDLLDMRTNAVEVALHRALASLRRVLETPTEPRAVPDLPRGARLVE